MKTDYPELEGKEITVIHSVESYTGIVVGCNRDIGITIINKDDHDHYLACLQGPSAPNYTGWPGANIEADHINKTIFKTMVTQIEAGLFLEESIYEIIRTYIPDAIVDLATKDFCPFS